MEDDAIVAPVDGTHGGAEVANVGNSMWPENRAADVRLISAAPDMLAALKLIARDLDIPGIPFCTIDAATAVQNAIDKAVLLQTNEVSGSP